VSNNQNSAQDYTCIDNAASNGNANAMVFFSRIWGNGHSQAYITAPLSVFYNSGNQKWCIYREDGVNFAIPNDTLFNVTIVTP
jgi:hypothetical protein